MANLRLLLSLLRPHRKKIFLAFIAILSSNLIGLAFPWTIKLLIDEVLLKKEVGLLNILCLSLASVFLLKFGFDFLREYLVSLTGEKIVSELRSRLHWHLQSLSVGFVANNPTGTLISGITSDVDAIRNFLFSGLVDFLYSFFNVFFVLIILFALDARLALICLVCIPFFAATFWKFTPRIKKQHGFVRNKFSRMVARMNEVFNGIRVVSGFAKEKEESDKFNLDQEKILQVSMGAHKSGIMLWVITDLFSSLSLVMLLWFGAKEVFSGRISTGSLMAFYSYAGMLFYPVIRMAVINNFYQEANAAMERINKTLNLLPVVQEIKNPLALNNLRGEIEFKNVSFSYTPDKQILRKINLLVKEREIIALVGKSGAGKTTLINLLLRFYDPSEGDILIDGHDLKEIGLRAYRSRIAMVLQDDYLFSGSLKENILYAKTNAAFGDVIKVAKLANAHQFIESLPRGYNTQIGERGIRLSFGQRQRISIARALLRDPAILILDEATSSVDSETEQLIIDQAFKKLIDGRTTFVIAHRLSTITYANRVIFLNNGTITESGSHLELLQKKGDYWKLWLEQSQDTAFETVSNNQINAEQKI